MLRFTRCRHCWFSSFSSAEKNTARTLPRPRSMAARGICGERFSTPHPTIDRKLDPHVELLKVAMRMHWTSWRAATREARDSAQALCPKLTTMTFLVKCPSSTSEKTPCEPAFSTSLLTTVAGLILEGFNPFGESATFVQTSTQLSFAVELQRLRMRRSLMKARST
jgi:hypothetical protein